MKKLALATAFLFASSMFVMAQSTTSPSSTDQQQQPSTTSPDQSSQQPSQQPSAQPPSDQSMGSQTSTSGSEQTIQGCLSQGANGFTLADASGTSYNLTGDTSKLSSHVGEQVEVKGTPSSSAAASTTQPSGAAPSSSAGQNFDVKSVKRISKSCSTSGDSTKPPSQ